MRKVYAFKRSEETNKVIVDLLEDGTDESHDPFYDDLSERLSSVISRKLVSAVPHNEIEYNSCWYGENESLYERIVERYKDSIENVDGSWDKRVQQSVMIIKTEEQAIDRQIITTRVEITKFDMDEIISFREHDTNYEPILDKIAYFITENKNGEISSRVFYKNKNTSKYWSNEFLKLEIENQSQIDTSTFFNLYSMLSYSDKSRVYYYVKSRSENDKNAEVNIHELESFITNELVDIQFQDYDLVYNVDLKELAKLTYPVNTTIKAPGFNLRTNVDKSEMIIFDDGNNKYIQINLDQNVLEDIADEYELEIIDGDDD